MINLGIDSNQHYVYEGSGSWGHALWPAPVLTPAMLSSNSDKAPDSAKRMDAFGGAYMFREDSFDPVAGIRRGRFYSADSAQSQRWFLQAHPAVPSELAEAAKHPQGVIEKQLNTYSGNPIWHEYFKDSSKQVLVCLGFGERITIWSVINVEAISTGEDLVTLKARRGLGILPELDESQIPKEYLKSVTDSLERLSDEVHRSTPVSIIDRARDAATDILLAYFEATQENARDIKKLTDQLEKETSKMIAVYASRIVARLHARAKPSEKLRRGLKAVGEQDAELATQCLGTLLCELGWAKWN